MEAKEAIDFLNGEWPKIHVKNIGTEGVKVLNEIAALIERQAEQIKAMRNCGNCKYDKKVIDVGRCVECDSYVDWVWEREAGQE